MRVRAAVPVLVVFLGSCGGPDPGPSAPGVTWLDADEHLVRASMAIRGKRPSPEELARVRADPDALPAIVDDYLQGEAFGETVKDMWAELLLVRADTRDVWPATHAMDWSTDGDIFRAMSEAPLRLIEDVVVRDRPFKEILTEDRVFADEVLTHVYGLEGWDPNGPEVQALPWSDGRPGAGVLSDTALWQRHESNGSNFHRGRANLFAGLFLCDDIGSRDIAVKQIDLSDPAVVSDAVRSVPSCAGCHVTLDPLAGHLWGFKGNMRRSGIFMAHNVYDCVFPYSDWCYPVRFYAPEESELWMENDLDPPAFHGESVGGLDGLGRAMGEDPAFATCMAERFGAWFLQHDREDLPPELVESWRGELVDSDFSARQLVRAIVLSDQFRAVSAARSDGPLIAGMLAIRPEQHARMVEDLTGFRFLADAGCAEGSCWPEVDLMVSDRYGFRAMAGGTDGYQVTQPTHGPTPTKHLVMSRVASEAAGYVVESDLAQSDPAQRMLLTELSGDEPGEAEVRRQLAQLHDRILAEPLAPSSAEIDATLELYEGALERSGGDPQAAWTLVISALLQDTRVLFY